VLLYSTLLILAAGLSDPYLEEYPWPPIGVFGLRLDGLSLPFIATIAILSAAISVYSIPYMEHRIREEVGGQRGADTGPRFGVYFALYILYAAGMMGAVVATNLIQFYLFFELMLIPSYFLIAEFGYGEREKISFMYFLWTHVGALVLLAGILSSGFMAGTFDLPVLVSVGEARIPLGIRVWIALAMSVGLFVKLAAFGLHIWLPHAHAEAPTPISALLSPAMIGIGGYALVRLVLTVLPSAFAVLSLALAVWAVVTMVYGGLMALAQDDIKRLLAYSSVSQMGYIIFGVATGQLLGVSGAMFQYVSHGTGKAILFMSAGAIILQAHGLRSIGRMGGLARRLPVTALCAMIGFLAILGFPSTNGFQSEWMIFAGAFWGALQQGAMERVALSAIAIISTGLTAGYALWAMRRVFFGPLPDGLREVKEAPATVLAPLLFLAFLTVLLGVYPELVTSRLIPAVRGVLQGA